MDRKVTELAINVVKEKIIEELVILFRVYRDTTVDVSLPTGVNLQEVIERLFDIEFSLRPLSREERVSFLNNLYCDLLSQGMESEYFLQVIQFLGG